MAKKKQQDVDQANGVIDINTKKPVQKKDIHVICRNLRHYRELKGMEQRELGAVVGAVGNTVSNWENGYSRPNLDHIPKLCEALGITLYELFGIEDPLYSYTEREKKLLSDYRELTDSSRFVVDSLMQSLRIVGSLEDTEKAEAESIRELRRVTLFDRSLAAGIGDPTEFLDTGSPLYLYDSRDAQYADYAFYVNGDSMEPEYYGGDIVLVQKASRSPKLREGDVGAFIYGNETYIKEYRRDGLHSFNPNYPTMHFEDEAHVFFIGKVLCIVDQEKDLAEDEDIERYISAHGETE